MGASPRGDTFILNLAYGLIRILKVLLPENVVRKVVGKRTPDFQFTDAWVLGSFFCAIAAWFFIGAGREIAVFFVIVGVLRLLEISVTNVDVMLGDPESGKPYELRDTRRSLVLGVMNFVEVMFWFAAFYQLRAALFNGQAIESLTGSLYLSMLTMATYGDVAPKTVGARWIVMVHLGLSLFLMLGVIGRFVALLPHRQASTVANPVEKPVPEKPVPPGGNQAPAASGGQAGE